MMSSLDLLMLLVGFSTIVWLMTQLSRKVQIGVIAAAFVAVMLNMTAQPALASAANDNALSSGQKELNETLKTTPQDNQYQGIEYPQVTGEALSDREITDRIKGEIPDNIKLSVSNGSVRLSGNAESRDAAQRIVQDVKEIPGVHEVSYDLGTNS